MNDTEKFMFNQHIFDEPEIEEEEHEEPPPPTYSQEELDSVREETYKRAYDQGKKDGIAESTASRDQQVAQVLQKIGQDTALIFNQEQQRDNIFEKESLVLALAVFEKLFPDYKSEIGFDDLEKSLQNILKKQEGQSQIRIEVHPDTLEGVQNHINSMNLTNQEEQRFDIIENSNLDSLGIKIYWKDGGAIKDIEAVAGEIRTILNDTLASAPLNSHDSKSIEEETPVSDLLDNKPELQETSEEPIDTNMEKPDE